ncbi:MAG: TA system VapC family ribonuclease toxin [Planctomycetota bacterium]
MIAVDTNILVYAHRAESPFHPAATRCLSTLSEGSAPWALPWPCIHEFLGIATHPRIFKPPTPLERALEQVERWFESPTLVLLAEAPGYWEILRKCLVAGRIEGPRVHDTRIAALCRLHGVSELWSADRDFSRFPDLAVRNPLVAR